MLKRRAAVIFRAGVGLFGAAVPAVLLTLAAAAQQAPPPTGPQKGWSLGPMLLVVDRPYRGRPPRVLPVPAIGYQGDYVFLQGIRFGVHVRRSRRFAFNVIAQPRLSSFSASDIPQIPGLEDRQDSVDVGFDMRVGLQRAGELGLTAVTDVLDRSNGQELDVRYRYPLRLGTTRVSPWAGVRWFSADLADYYYGTLPSEVARGAPYYRPGAVFMPQIGISVFAPIGRSRWSVFVFYNTAFLPAALRNSPLVGADTSSTAVAGVFYRF